MSKSKKKGNPFERKKKKTKQISDNKIDYKD